MRRSPLLLLPVVALLSGCIIDRSALGGSSDGMDGGSAVDAWLAPGTDAPGLDAHVEGVDAFELAMLDAPDRLEPDVPIAPIVDAWVAPTPDAPACLSVAETCNAHDDDCDGRVDEAACGGPTPLPGVSILCAMFRHADRVYQFCKASVSVPWEAALMACQATGVYDLVQIDDNAENGAIDAAIDVNAWLGLNDRDTENWFVWADGTPLSATFASWAVTEPSSAMGSMGNRGQNCVVMRGGGPIWEDRGCGVLELDPRTDVTAFVCEAPIIP